MEARKRLEEGKVDKIDWCHVGAKVQVKNYPITCWTVKRVTDDDGVLIQSENVSTYVCRTEIEPWNSHPMNHEHQDHKEGEGVREDTFGPKKISAELMLQFMEDRVKSLSESDDGASGAGNNKAVHNVLSLIDLTRKEFGIQSHRDKCVEAAERFFTDQGFCPNRGQLGKAYDAGLLRLPNDKEGE